MIPSFRPRAALSLLQAASLLAATPACSSSPAGNSDSSSSVETGQSAFPAGAYDNCAYSTFLDTPGGGGFSGVGGSIVVNQTASTIRLTYGGDGGALDASLSFTATSDTSATLVTGQELAGIQVSCAPLQFAPAVTRLASGSLTYNAGTLFLSVVGTVQPLDDSCTGLGCCSNPGGQGAFFVTCGGPMPADAGASSAGSTAAAEESGFVGVYQCSSATQQFGGDLIGVTSGAGTLTVTRDGQVLTAAYDDTALEGSLKFVAVASSAAVPATPDETMQIDCNAAGAGVPPGLPLVGGPTMTSVSVASSTLALDGDHVVLAFAGSGCGESFAVSVLCEPGDGGVVDEGADDASGGDGGASDGAMPTTDSAFAVAAEGGP